MEEYFIANEIKEGLLRNLCAPEKLSSLSFKDVVETLQQHLSPKPLLIAKRFRFHRRNQLEGETVSAYQAKLWKLSLYCEFGTNTQRTYPETTALRAKFIIGQGNGNCPSAGSGSERHLRATGEKRV